MPEFRNDDGTWFDVSPVTETDEVRLRIVRPHENESWLMTEEEAAEMSRALRSALHTLYLGRVERRELKPNEHYPWCSCHHYDPCDCKRG